MPTPDVPFNVIKHAHCVLKDALGLANTKEIVVCLAPHHVIAFYAINAAPKTCLANTNALDYVARFAPRIIAKNVQPTRKLDWIFLK